MVSRSDRNKMRQIAADLATGESVDRGTSQQRAALLAVINADRVRSGEKPFSDRAPEEGFYDRARSLGMARIDR